MIGFLAQNWGNLASVAGLGVSLWVLVVARGARKAAEDARSAARLKNLTEVLEEASSKMLQVGVFLSDRKWDLVQLRSSEISAACRLALTRWGDYLSEARKDNLNEAATLASSIAGVAAESTMRELGLDDLQRASRAQIEAADLISSILGEAQKSEERT